MKFSQRMGITPIKEVIQLEGMDEALRNSLWNVLHESIWKDVKYDSWVTIRDTIANRLLKSIWSNFFKKPLDSPELAGKTLTSVSILRKFFLENAHWYEVYDLLEFIVGFSETYGIRNKLITSFNLVLEREVSGYRFIEGNITTITSEIEIEEVNQSLKNNKFNGVQIHLKQALTLLSDRKNPDYRNSIKESISAVESLCKVITSNPKATLGEAIKKFEQEGLFLHPSLKESINKLYGYTSDEKGIRHALIEGNDNITFSEAKYILVICSGFTNYLISKLQ